MDFTHPSTMAHGWLEPSLDVRASLSSGPLWPHRLALTDPEPQNLPRQQFPTETPSTSSGLCFFVCRGLEMLHVRETVAHTAHKETIS